MRLNRYRISLIDGLALVGRDSGQAFVPYNLIKSRGDLRREDSPSGYRHSSFLISFVFHSQFRRSPVL